MTRSPGPSGLFGKLPSRGDFLRAGLPRGFTDPWDSAMGAALAGSRRVLGEAWLPAWMEAPIWRFVLPAGMCGEAEAVGVWMPSVDRAGRHFPLMLAHLDPDWGNASAWLGRAEAAGLAALADELGPDETLALLAGGAAASVALPDLAALATGHAVWWTEGSPFVPPGALAIAMLPDGAILARMIDARDVVEQAEHVANGATAPQDAAEETRP